MTDQHDLDSTARVTNDRMVLLLRHLLDVAYQEGLTCKSVALRGDRADVFLVDLAGVQVGADAAAGYLRALGLPIPALTVLENCEHDLFAVRGIVAGQSARVSVFVLRAAS